MPQKTFVVLNKFLMWKWPATLKRLGRPALDDSILLFAVKQCITYAVATIVQVLVKQTSIYNI